MVASRRDRGTVRDLEGLDEAFAGRVHVELEAVTAAESPVHRGHEDAVALPHAVEIERHRRLDLVKQLLDGTGVDPRAVVDPEAQELNRGTGHEAERRGEIAADPLVVQRDVPLVVRVVDLESPGARVVAAGGMIRRQAPHADEEIPVAAEARRRIREITASRPSTRCAKRVANRRDGTDP